SIFNRETSRDPVSARSSGRTSSSQSGGSARQLRSAVSNRPATSRPRLTSCGSHPYRTPVLSAHRDLESLVVCELHELGDVLRIAGPEHGGRPVMHDMSKVGGCRLQNGFVEELAALFDAQKDHSWPLNAAQKLLNFQMRGYNINRACPPIADTDGADYPLRPER